MEARPTAEISPPPQPSSIKGEGDNTVFSFQFSVKRLLIIMRLAIKFVAAETELGISPQNLSKIILRLDPLAPTFFQESFYFRLCR
jgi:hypothetical protein